MPEFNEQLARNALKAIERSPEHWEQKAYRCGTGMCFAGFVAMEAGASWMTDYDENHVDAYELHVKTPDGEEMAIDYFAAEALGLNKEEAWDIFHPSNRLEDLKKKIDKYSK